MGTGFDKPLNDLYLFDTCGNFSKPDIRANLAKDVPSPGSDSRNGLTTKRGAEVCNARETRGLSVLCTVRRGPRVPIDLKHDLNILLNSAREDEA